MFFAITYPIIDLRSYIQAETYSLDYGNSQLSSIYDSVFLRSIGDLRYSNRFNDSVFGKQNEYYNARKAIKVNDISAYRNKSYNGNLFVPKIVTRHLYTERNIFRYELGISSYIAFRKKLTSPAIENITQWILCKSISIPTKGKRKNMSIYGAGKYLAELTLYSTTKEPTQNYEKVSRKWMQSGNPMVIIECNNNDLLFDNDYYDLAGYEKYLSEELDNRGIVLYHSLFSNSIHVWIISFDVATPYSDVINLSIMLRKIHQNREGLKRVLKAIDGDMINLDDKRIEMQLRNCIEHLSKPIISKSFYGYSCYPILSLIRQYDEIVNEKEEDYIKNKLKQIPNFCSLYSRIRTAISNDKYDLFISHASEDNSYTELLVNELIKLDVKVWYDKYELEISDNLVRRIEYGISRSNAGLLIISNTYLEKNWTKAELDALISLMINKDIYIFPILLDLTYEELISKRPLLASTLGKPGLPDRIEDIAMAIKRKMVAMKLNCKD